MKNWILTTAALTCLGFAEAHADNHFLFELDMGFNQPFNVEGLDLGVGGSYGATFGFGGRFGAPALYLVGRFGYSNFDYNGPATGGNVYVEREAIEFGFGGRAYLPMTERVRLMVQILFGGTFDDSSVQHLGYQPYLIEDSAFTISADFGIQYRVNNHFSIGFGVSTDWYPTSNAFNDAPLYVGALEGLDGQINFDMTMTFHF